jgi:hypothetical protein
MQSAERKGGTTSLNFRCWKGARMTLTILPRFRSIPLAPVPFENRLFMLDFWSGTISEMRFWGIYWYKDMRHDWSTWDVLGVPFSQHIHAPPPLRLFPGALLTLVDLQWLSQASEEAACLASWTSWTSRSNKTNVAYALRKHPSSPVSLSYPRLYLSIFFWVTL